MAITPQVAARASALLGAVDDSTLDTSPNQPFLLAHFPRNVGSWSPFDFGDEAVWLPVLKPLPVVPGVWQVRSPSEGEKPGQRLHLFRARVLARGGTLIDPGTPIPDDLTPPGVSGAGGYLLETPCNGGVWTHHCWDVPQQPLKGRAMIPQHFEELYARWRLSLALDGVVPEPLEDVIRDARMDADRRVSLVEFNTAQDDDKIKNRRVSRFTARAELVARAIFPAEYAAKKSAPPKRAKASA